jgi:hypothetical protein
MAQACAGLQVGAIWARVPMTAAYASVLMLRSSRSRACPMQVRISYDNTILDDDRPGTLRPRRLDAPTPTIAAAAISQPTGSHTGALIASLHVNATWSATRLHAGGLSWVDPAGAAAPDRSIAGVPCATVGVARSGLADSGPYAFQDAGR